MARRDYNPEQQEWGWARPAPVSQKSGGDASSSPKKARRKVSHPAVRLLSCPPCLGTGLYARAPRTCPFLSNRSNLETQSRRGAAGMFCRGGACKPAFLPPVSSEALLVGAGLRAGARAPGVHLHAVQAAAEGAAVHALRAPLLQALPGEAVRGAPCDPDWTAIALCHSRREQLLVCQGPMQSSSTCLQ